MFSPDKIILHHSKTPDNRILPNWEAIVKYHKSWRYNFETVTEEEAQKLVLEGHKVTPPWSDVGYHAGVELINDKPITRPGRPLGTMGAHCLGQNYNSIGVCFIGDFDLGSPREDILYHGALLLMNFCQALHISITEIYGHRDFWLDRTCPGKLFDIGKIKEMVSDLNGIGSNFGLRGEK
jgi:N-acetylmuramoyl-L-alanine amidase